MDLCLLLVILGHFLGHAACLTKTYYALNQWLENPKIWSAKRLPCSQDTVVLPENVAIYLDKPLSASKIILPKNGILILDQANWIEKNESLCAGGQENKLLIRKNDWFDTSSFTVKYHVFEFDGTDELSNPIPHINRIPCDQDELRFRPKSTFKLSIDLDDKHYNLKNLFINNKKLVGRDFLRYTVTRIGKLQFSIKGQYPFDVSSSDDPPESDHEVRTCHYNFNHFFTRICRNVVANCPQLDCLNPIQPTGFCCPICGSVVRINHRYSDPEKQKNYKTLNNDFIENTLFNLHFDKYQGVNFFMSKVSDTKIEIILLDRKDHNPDLPLRESRSFAQELTRLFKKENLYQLQSIEHEYSEYPEENGKGRYLLYFFLILVLSTLLFAYRNSNGQNRTAIRSRLLSIYEQISQQVQRQVQANLPANCRSATDSPLTFLRFSHDHEDGLEMEINQPSSQPKGNGFRLRTKNDSISSNISSILFTVDEQDEEISFDNPIFKQYKEEAAASLAKSEET